MVEQWIFQFWFGTVGQGWFWIISAFTLPISALYHLHRLTKD